LSSITDPFIPRQPFNGWTPDWRLTGLTGIEQVRWGGPTRIDPVGTLLGFDATEVNVGQVTFEMPWCPWGVGFDGEMSPGMLALLADAAHSAAVQTTLPPMHLLTTVGLTLSLLAPVPPDSGDLVCRASIAEAARGWPILSTGWISDANGRLLAQTTARCVTAALPADPPDEPPPDPVPEELMEFTARAPTRGAPPGEVLPSDVRESSPGVELLNGLATGALPLPPIYHLTGLKPAQTEPDEAVFTMAASHWIASITSNVQGGALALLAEAAASGAVVTTLSGGQSPRATELSISYVRPVLANGEEITGHAAILHRGRTFAVTRGHITDAGGKAVAYVDASHAL
jgi:uncharacterized protein (TIGR00369 family)